MICDLNLVYPVTDFNEEPTGAQLNQLKSAIYMAQSLGYTHVALNFCPKSPTSETNKKKLPTDINQLNPINLSKQFGEFENEKIKIFTRITVKIDDPGQCQNIAKFQTLFDIVAVQPITEKAFQSIITNLDVDIISFDLQDRLPCFMKHKTLCSAIDKGIKFEIKYSDFLNNQNRALAISNAKQIIRASRGKGMICSSGAKFSESGKLRNIFNVIPLLHLIGINSVSLKNNGVGCKGDRAQMMFTEWPIKVLINGRLRIKSYKQTITLAGDDNLIDNSLEDKDWLSNNKGNIKLSVEGYKKRKAVELEESQQIHLKKNKKV